VAGKLYGTGYTEAYIAAAKRDGRLLPEDAVGPSASDENDVRLCAVTPSRRQSEGMGLNAFADHPQDCRDISPRGTLTTRAVSLTACSPSPWTTTPAITLRLCASFCSCWLCATPSSRNAIAAGLIVRKNMSSEGELCKGIRAHPCFREFASTWPRAPQTSHTRRRLLMSWRWCQPPRTWAFTLTYSTDRHAE